MRPTRSRHSRSLRGIAIDARHDERKAALIRPTKTRVRPTKTRANDVVTMNEQRHLPSCTTCGDTVEICLIDETTHGDHTDAIRLTQGGCACRFTVVIAS